METGSPQQVITLLHLHFHTHTTLTCLKSDFYPDGRPGKDQDDSRVPQADLDHGTPYLPGGVGDSELPVQGGIFSSKEPGLLGHQGQC